MNFIRMLPQFNRKCEIVCALRVVCMYVSEGAWLVLSACSMSMAEGSGPTIEWFRMIFNRCLSYICNGHHVTQCKCVDTYALDCAYV